MGVQMHVFCWPNNTYVDKYMSFCLIEKYKCEFRKVDLCMRGNKQRTTSISRGGHAHISCQQYPSYISPTPHSSSAGLPIFLKKRGSAHLRVCLRMSGQS